MTNMDALLNQTAETFMADRVVFNPEQAVLAIELEDRHILRFDGFTSYDGHVEVEEELREAIGTPGVAEVDPSVTKVTITLRLEHVRAWSLGAPEDEERKSVTV